MTFAFGRRGPSALVAALLACLALTACQTSHASSSALHTEAHATEHAQQDAHVEQQAVTHVEQGPGETITYRFAPPAAEELGELPPGTEPVRPLPIAPASKTASAPGGPSWLEALGPHGPLLEVVDQKTGPVSTDTQAHASEDLHAKADGESGASLDAHANHADEMKPAMSCVSLGWLYGLALLVAVAGIAWMALKRT